MTWCDVASPADQAGIRTSRHLVHNFNAAHRPLSELFVFPPTHAIHMSLRSTSPSYGVGFLGTNSFINKYLRQFSSSSGYSLRASRFGSSSVYYPIRVIGLCWRRVGCGGAPRFVSPPKLRLVRSSSGDLRPRRRSRCDGGRRGATGHLTKRAFGRAACSFTTYNAAHRPLSELLCSSVSWSALHVVKSHSVGTCIHIGICVFGTCIIATGFGVSSSSA